MHKILCHCVQLETLIISIFKEPQFSQCSELMFYGSILWNAFEVSILKLKRKQMFKFPLYGHTKKTL